MADVGCLYNEEKLPCSIRKKNLCACLEMSGDGPVLKRLARRRILEQHFLRDEQHFLRSNGVSGS